MACNLSFIVKNEGDVKVTSVTFTSIVVVSQEWC